MNKMICDKNGKCIEVGTVMYNPFWGDYWTVINVDGILSVELMGGKYITELEDIIDTFIVADKYVQKR